MSAPAPVEQKPAAETPVDGQKPRKKKTPPLTSEQFTAEANNAEAEWMKIHKYYANFNKHGLRTAETSPNSTETGSLLKKFSRLCKLYDYLEKKPKRKAGPQTKGFTQEKFLQASAVKFFNDSAQFTPEMQIVPRPEAGGDGIACISQAISVIASHVERNRLKRNPEIKTEITFDSSLKALFAPHMGAVEKKKWHQNEAGEIVTTQTVIQSLIPKLFDSKVPVHPKLYSDEEKSRMALRGPHLSGRTEANGKARAKAKEDQKEAEKAAAAAAAAAAKASVAAPK